MTGCANCRETFDDGSAHFHWAKPMGSLLELLAAQLEERRPSLTAVGA
jgi:hypothetical protein